ncbi:lipase family protein [Williamsia sp. 1135]|uniref:lipase family protein n=1 Tax=Williamsia sp. 1135 TaxID=1889262 RepID=UPI001F0AF059|nr:lipase family protein [Williamsia sp. 1135]
MGARLLVLALAMLLLTVPVTALAAPAPNVDDQPRWSGLDARQYNGPIPDVPGTLIRSVPLDPELVQAPVGDAFRILYSTPNQHSDRATSTAFVYVPLGQAPPGGWPVIAWAHGTVGLGDDCTPSANRLGSRVLTLIEHWLTQGYAIVGTDYSGQGTPGLMSYLNSQVQASSVIDSVKAVHQMGLPLSPKYAITGQSQGAGAALNAGRRATELDAGSGLDYRGVIGTGTPANIEWLVQFGGPGFPPVILPAGLTTYAMYIVAGLRDARRDLDVDGLLTPLGRQLVDTAETMCMTPFKNLMAGRDLREAFVKPVSSLPDAYGVLRRHMETPATGYDRPVFLGHGLLDIDVPIPFPASLIAEMTVNREPVEVHVYPEDDHFTTMARSVVDATRFMNTIMR